MSTKMAFTDRSTARVRSGRTGTPRGRLSPSPSFDHLVGLGKQCRWQVEAEHLGGLEIDNALEFCRLLDWDICGLFALRDLVDEFGRTPLQLPPVGSV